ncbi:restriction endonuclease subunit S [Tritonibacter mobilis]|uniref:restriction endonuclease subunit S n=1 Tax=Tritonibacter mobilis TaxID=379347 RepID=UPI0014021F5F|nr:restriction endonuclease subunit S [Tritonibacter mobilis]NHM20599.1 type I restriction endonuclease subunit S [Tritonibacter mobilis]NHM24761.1 type I restriction endonuclease subunit S [Tritonibacter mobilis]
MRAYADYRSSDTDWLGRIPASWEAVPLKHIADFVNGAAFKPEQWSEQGAPIIRIENLNGGTDFNHFEGDVEERYHVKQGDILFGWSGNRGTSFGPFIWSRPGHFLLNQHIFNVRGFSGDQGWFYWCLKAVTEYVEQQAHGIIGMVHVTKGNLGRIRVPLPPLAEQQAIAAFLDRETAKLDGLVEEQRRLIALLKEKRQAVISHAVTRGLDPTAPLKPSGIDWLGDIPAHWEAVPLKYLTTFKSGGTPSKTNLAYWDGDVPWVSARDLKTAVITDSTYHITQQAVDDGAASLVPIGSILVLVRGMTLAHSFPVCIAGVPTAINQDLKALTPNAGTDGGFLAWSLRGLAEQSLSRIDEAGHGTKALRMEAWTPMEIPLPPEPEQCRIAVALEEKMARLDALTAEATRAIALLQERRAALISAAVTGKIDVRDSGSDEEAA